jgi:general secretion pathway protein K
MVLWICAALAAVAFALATTVRGETERTSTELDELRGYYLAAGAVDRAAVEILWSAVYTDQRKIKQGAAWIDYTFPSGVARVEFIPEAAKLNVNSIAPERLSRLLMALGVDPAHAAAITQGIVARRGGAADPNSALGGPSFSGPAASFQEIEELLAVRGVTPEVFYGTYVPADGNVGGTLDGTFSGQTRLIRRSGLVDCLSVYGTTGAVDANTADPAVLAALGMSPDGIQLLVRQRRIAWLNPATLGQLLPALGPAAGMLRLEGNSILTLRATAQVRLPNGKLSDMRRTVAAQVKYTPAGSDAPIHVLRWYDTTWTN